MGVCSFISAGLPMDDNSPLYYSYPEIVWDEENAVYKIAFRQERLTIDPQTFHDKMKIFILKNDASPVVIRNQVVYFIPFVISLFEKTETP